MRNLFGLLALISFFGCTSKLMPKGSEENNGTQVRIQAINTSLYSYEGQDTTIDVSSENMIYDRAFLSSMDEIACNYRYAKDGNKIKSVKILSYRPFDLVGLKSLISLDDFEENAVVLWKMDRKDKFSSRKLSQNYYPGTDKTELLYDRIDSFSIKAQLESSFYYTKDCPACVSWKRFYTYNEQGAYSDTTFFIKKMADTSFVKEFYTKFEYDEQNRKIATYSLDTGHYANDRWEEHWSYSEDSLLYEKFKYNNYSGKKEYKHLSISTFDEQNKPRDKVIFKKHLFLDTIIKKEELIVTRNEDRIQETKHIFKFGNNRTSDVGALESTQNNFIFLDVNGRVIRELQTIERIGLNRIDTTLLINQFYEKDSHLLPSRYQVVKKLRQRFKEDYSYIFDDQNRIVEYTGPNKQGYLIKKEIEYFSRTKDFLDLPYKIRRNIYPPHIRISIPKIKSVRIFKMKNDQWQLYSAQEFIY